MDAYAGAVQGGIDMISMNAALLGAMLGGAVAFAIGFACGVWMLRSIDKDIQRRMEK